MGKQYGVFLVPDFETSGIDEEKNHPLELAAHALDHNLELIGSYHSLMKAHEEFLNKNQFNEKAWEMHQENGLIKDLREREEAGNLSTVAECNKHFAEWVLEVREEHLRKVDIGDEPCPIFLVGNNVESFDLKWFNAWMPDVVLHLHYRTINVSAMRMTLALALGVDQHTLKEEMGFGGHRAMDDVRACILEWKRYIEYFRLGSVELAKAIASRGTA